MTSAMPTSGSRSPLGVRRTTPAPSISWPSRKMVALTSKVSPATALADRRPHSRTGCTSRMGMRPITSERYPLAGPVYQLTLKLTGDAAPEFFCRPFAGPVRGSRRRALGSRCVRAIRHFVVRATLPEPLAALRALMLNLRWSWHPGTRELFAAIDPAGRAEAGRDPAALLGEVPPEHLAQLAADPGYLARLAEAASELEEYLTGPRWYQRSTEELGGAPAAVAYFSPEYGIASALPQYSGGLGILAGDHLKAASDLGVPLIGVGLLYRHGYFSQSLSAEGWQQEHYPGADPNGLLLGIGGVRAVRAFCALTGHPQPEVFHTNEGHAGFLGLERIREYAQAGLSFDEAIEVCRAGTVFTTHTPVAAGIDRFPRTLVEQHFSGPAGDPALPADRVLALGAETYPGGDPEVFNMAVMGMRLAQRVNGVSRLHGRVSRAMFAGLWPGFDPGEVPIGSITNGVHAATWVAPEILALAAGDGRPTGPVDPELAEDGQAWERAAAAGPARTWEIRRLLRGRLVEAARRRLRASWRQRGVPDAELGWTEQVLDAGVLTIGFARRVPSYKRLTLMLHDPERLRSLLTDPRRPVQIVIAGKAHPADEGGKQLIQQMVRFADEEAVRHRLVFLPDYDMELAHALVQGCDVWLNNPLRPLEACGTSGMKSALNGGLNLSIKDGWWDEWHDGENGWAIPSAEGVPDGDRRDALESAALYDLVR